MFDDEVNRLDDEILAINERLDTLFEAAKGTLDYMRSTQEQIKEKETEVDILSSILLLLIGTLALHLPQFSNEFADELEDHFKNRQPLFEGKNYTDHQIKLFDGYVESFRKMLVEVALIKNKASVASMKCDGIEGT